MARKQLDKLVTNETHALVEYKLKREHLLLEFLMKDTYIDTAPATVNIASSDSIPVLNSSLSPTTPRSINWAKLTVSSGRLVSVGDAEIRTDLSIINRNTTTLDIASSSGDDVTLPAATTVLAGLMTAAQFNIIATLGDVYVPYIGAIKDVDLGTYSVILDSIKFNLAPTVTGAAGELWWNAQERTLSLSLEDGGSFEIGEELGDYYVNLEGSTMYNGDVVSVTGATGNRSACKLTDATDNYSAELCIGMVTVPTINNNNTGRVTKMGKVRGLNTSAWLEGTQLYVDPLNKGKLTGVMPQAPNYAIHVGVVEVSHAVNGVIHLAIHTVPKLVDLSDVNGTPLITTGQIPVWDQTRLLFDFTENIFNYVKGPATSTDNAIARFDGTTGKLIQNSTVLISDAGAVTINALSGTGTRISTITSGGQVGALANGSEGQIVRLVSSTPTWVDLTGSIVINTPAGNISSTTVQAAINELDTEKVSYTILDAAKMLTGFVNGSAITVTYDWTNRTITLDGDLSYQWRGMARSLVAPWTSPVHPNTVGPWFLMSTDGTNFIWSQSPWAFSDLMVSYVYYRNTAANTFAVRETHGLMDYYTHEELHAQIGTYVVSGGKLTGGTYAFDTATDAATTPGIDSAVLKDEDLTSVEPAWIEGTYTTMYVGPGNTSVFSISNTTPFIGTTNTFMQVNDLVTGTMVAGINNKFYNVYQILVPVAADSNSTKYRVIMLQPQATYDTLLAAQSEDKSVLNLGDLGNLSLEFNIHARITFTTSSSYTNIGKCVIPTGGIQYLLTAKNVNVGGGTGGSGTTNHAALTNLSWVVSGHIGSANSVPAFDSAGLAILRTDLVSSTNAFTTNNAITRVDGTGRIIKQSLVTIDDSGNISTPGTGTFTGQVSSSVRFVGPYITLTTGAGINKILTTDNAGNSSWVYPKDINIAEYNHIVTQTGHGFVVGDAIKPTLTGWIKTQANNANNAGTVGIVSSVINANTFAYLTEGIIPGAYTVGADYFLSTSVSGGLMIVDGSTLWSEGQVVEYIGSGTVDGLHVSVDVGQEIQGTIFQDKYVSSVAFSTVTRKLTLQRTGGLPTLETTIPEYVEIDTLNSVLTRGNTSGLGATFGGTVYAPTFAISTGYQIEKITTKLVISSPSETDFYINGINVVQITTGGAVSTGGTITTPNIKITTGATPEYVWRCTNVDGSGAWSPIAASNIYKGTWNPVTNTPTLADGSGVAGWYYRVTVAGTWNGITFAVGDDVIYNGSIWQRIPGQGYILPPATASILGGVKIGAGVSVTGDGTISVSTNYQAPLLGTGLVYSTAGVITYDTNTYATQTWVSSNYSPLGHTHNYVPLTRNVNTTMSLTGGGALSADRTLSLVNDNAAPGKYYVYGTDMSGNKGWITRHWLPITNGIYFPSLPDFVNSYGYVGVGNINPEVPFHVVHNAPSKFTTIINNTDSNTGHGLRIAGGDIAFEIMQSPNYINRVFRIYGNGVMYWYYPTSATASKMVYYNDVSGLMSVGAVPTLSSLGGISLTSLSALSPIYYDNTIGQFSMIANAYAPYGTVSFPGFGTTHITAAYGDHTHTAYEVPVGTTLQYYRGDKSWQTLNTAVVPESGNLYFTNARARSAISLTTTGTSGLATYDSINGILNIPNYTSAGTVSSITSGAGMNFTTITGSGTVVMGTPSTLTLSTTNSASGTTHTHVLDLSGRAVYTQHSLMGGGTLGIDRTLSLVGDVASPGVGKFYGTNGVGTRGWYDSPIDTNYYPNGLWFNSSDGVLHLDMVGTGNLITSSLDSRYSLIHSHPYDNYGAWFYYVNSSLIDSIDASNGVNFVAGSGVSLSGYSNGTTSTLIISASLAGYATETWVSNNFDKYGSWWFGTSTFGMIGVGSGNAVKIVAGTGITITDNGLGNSTSTNPRLVTISSTASGTTNHAALSNLTYGSTGHESTFAYINGSSAQAFNTANLSATGTINATSTITGSEVYRGSSRDIKHNIMPYYGDAMNILRDTMIHTYYLNVDNSFSIGFIAEDTHPWLSGPSQKGHVFGNHLGILTKAIQEIDIRVLVLEMEITRLQTKLKELEDARR